MARRLNMVAQIRAAELAEVAKPEKPAAAPKAKAKPKAKSKSKKGA